MKLIDISPAVHGATPVWPGDHPFQLAAHWDLGAGDSVTVGTITTTTHVGAHIDAPAHVLKGAASVAETPLEACIGKSLVLDVSDLVDRDANPHGPVPAAAVIERVRERTSAPVERLLLRHYDDRQEGWDGDLPGVEVDLMTWFASQGGLLMGIDLASFDPAESKTLACHRMAIDAGVVLLEGLDLADAPEGPAELIALPLRWAQADASPVRAILRYPDNQPHEEQT